jgi:predicted nucleotidyltransferase
VSKPIAITLVLAVALLAAVPAPAAEAPTREAYVERLEKTCKPDALATQRVMKGARADVQAERSKAAAEKFAKATAIFGSTVRDISAVTRPPDDTDRLAKWFTYLKRQESYLGQITEQLRQDHAIKAQRLTARFIHTGNLANNVVLAFGFDWCSFKFSRYG